MKRTFNRSRQPLEPLHSLLNVLIEPKKPAKRNPTGSVWSEYEVLDPKTGLYVDDEYFS